MLGLRTLIYLVSDIDHSKVWFSQAFKTKPYFDEPYYVGFNIGGYELGLQPGEKKNEGEHDNILGYWGVEDIASDYKRLLDMGAKEHEAPTNVGGELMVATVRDPWGNLIGLIYNPHFKL